MPVTELNQGLSSFSGSLHFAAETVKEDTE
jgi:hypothetical protein